MKTLPARSVTFGPKRAGLCWGQTTRVGGHSKDVYGHFNLADHVGEAVEVTAANWLLLESILGWSRQQVATCTQVHGATVIEVVKGGAHSVQADALISRTPGLAVGIFTADCVPVLLAHRGSRSVAAIHCGWRGIRQGLASKTLTQLLCSSNSQETLDSSPHEVDVWIGAHIATCNYEVGEELAAQFPGHVLRKRELGKWKLDLASALLEELSAEGICPLRVERATPDTYTDQAYYSYRRDGATTGRMLSWVGYRSD